MILAEIKLSSEAGASELRLDTSNANRAPCDHLISMARNESEGILLVLVGRLFYRNELKRRWALRLDDNTSSSADWALAAYRAGALPALNDMEGEFSLMIYDRRVRLLHLHRSIFGHGPLYWLSRHGVVIAGTSLRSLAAQVTDWDINVDQIVSFLTNPHSLGSSSEDTALSPIRRVLPGTRISIDAAGKVECDRFWSWQRLIKEDSRLTRAEAGARYLELLGGPVGERMNGERTAVELSVGFDSSTIACLARDQLLRKESSESLLTLSLDYDFPEMTDEQSCMRLITDQGDPFEPVYLREEAALDYDGFPHEVLLHDEPSAYLFRFAIDQQMLDVARGWGAHRLLTGGGAELLLEPRLEYLTDLSRNGEWRRGLQQAGQWALDRQTTVGTLAWQHMVAPLIPGGLQKVLNSFGRNGLGRTGNMREATPAPWIERSLIDKLP